VQVPEDDERTLTNQVRRAQIVRTTIELIAEDGYRAATLQGVARRAGIASTRTISYHFAGKDDLIAAATMEIFQIIGGYVAEHATAAEDPREALADYIRAAVGLNATHRVEMRALTAIVLDHRPAGQRPYEEKQENTAVGRVQDILERGQQAGVFGEFDPWVMATTVQRSLDSIAFVLDQRPDLDLEHFAEELVRIFDRATRATRTS
jgi:AcrR family transcriptional regulator